MTLALKVLVGVVAVAALLGIGFYAWLVIAFEPPKAKPDKGVKTVTKSGALGDGAIFTITEYRPDPQAAPDWTVATGLANDETGPRSILVASGAPKPVDARLAAPRRVEVLFDGPLAGGRTSMVVEVGEDYASEGLLVLRNGKTSPP